MSPSKKPRLSPKNLNSQPAFTRKYGGMEEEVKVKVELELEEEEVKEEQIDIPTPAPPTALELAHLEWLKTQELLIQYETERRELGLERVRKYSLLGYVVFEEEERHRHVLFDRRARETAYWNRPQVLTIVRDENFKRFNEDKLRQRIMDKADAKVLHVLAKQAAANIEREAKLVGKKDADTHMRVAKAWDEYEIDCVKYEAKLAVEAYDRRVTFRRQQYDRIWRNPGEVVKGLA